MTTRTMRKAASSVGIVATLVLAAAAMGCAAKNATTTTPHASMLVSDGPAPVYRLDRGGNYAFARISSFGVSRNPMEAVSYAAHVRFAVSNRGARPLLIDPGQVLIASADDTLEPLKLEAGNGQPYWTIPVGEERTYDAAARVPLHVDRNDIAIVRVHWGYKAEGETEPEKVTTIFLPVKGSPQYNDTLALRAALSPFFYESEKSPPVLSDRSIRMLR